MRWIRGALRSAARDESGMSLVELLVSMTMMSIVATIFITVLFTVQNRVTEQSQRSIANDQAKAGIEQVDREVRSGNLLYDPSEAFAAPTCGGYACVANFSLRVYTQTNATTRTPPQQCVQWIVHDRKLMRRAWAPGGSTSLGGWRTVAEGVVNRDLSPAVPAFTMDPAPGGRVLNVTLMLNPRLGLADAPRTVRVNTSIAIRNSSSGDPCGPIPTS